MLDSFQLILRPTGSGTDMHSLHFKTSMVAARVVPFLKHMSQIKCL